MLITRLAFRPRGCVLRRVVGAALPPVPVVEGTFTSEEGGVCLPIAALILSAFLVPPGSYARAIIGSFEDGSTLYIIVDKPSLIMCSGNFGWLFSKRKNPVGEQFRGLPLLQFNPPRLKRSGIYSFGKPMSISCGHLFFQCIIVCYLRLHLKF